MVLPYFIPEEAEKIVNQTPVWKIKLVKESLKYMMTDEDEGTNWWLFGICYLNYTLIISRQKDMAYTFDMISTPV